MSTPDTTKPEGFEEAAPPAVAREGGIRVDDSFYSESKPLWQHLMDKGWAFYWGVCMIEYEGRTWKIDP